jgi:protein-tyrosine phosphatase
MDSRYEPPSSFVNTMQILTAKRPEFTDFVEVIPNLFLGSHPEGHDPFAFGAQVVVCLSSNASVEAPPSDGMFLHWPIQDGPLPDEATLRHLARFIADLVGRSLTVFVHCDAGLNRSALLVGRVLVERGMSPADAVRLIRARRKGSLSNTYETWLLSQA